MAYKTLLDRSQINLFPVCLEDSIAADNIVRVIDAFVNWLDLKDLKFKHAKDNIKGASMYPPAVLLKLYLYGYLNRIRSSRRLASECARNVELFWLLQRSAPQYHTIADFRKDNAGALKEVFKQFTQFCITLSLIEGKTVVVDGTKIRAQNNKSNNFTAGRLEKLLARMDVKMNEYQGYETYLKELDEQDTEEATKPVNPIPVGKTKADIENTLKLLKERYLRYKSYQDKLKAAAASEDFKTEDLQISTVDPDARSMSFRQMQTEVGYNVQTVADEKNSLIIHFEVTNVNDANALSVLTKDVKEVLHAGKTQTIAVLADAGYHTAAELEKCIGQGMNTYVCPPDVAAAQGKTGVDTEKFSKDKFIYDAREDAYTCPNQQKLKSNGVWYEQKKTPERRKAVKYKQYTLPSAVCRACPFAGQCQGNRKKQWHGKTIQHGEHESAVRANAERMSSDRAAYEKRKRVIEHPFGTIKRGWGYYYTLVKTKKKVGGEFALIYVCYNLRRVSNILGVKELVKALNTLILSIPTQCKQLKGGFFKEQRITPVFSNRLQIA